MSSFTRSPSENLGTPPHGGKPQVVVRAGKTFVCMACGTLVEIPADVVGQYVLVPASEAAGDRSPSPASLSNSSLPTSAPDTHSPVSSSSAPSSKALPLRTQSSNAQSAPVLSSPASPPGQTATEPPAAAGETTSGSSGRPGEAAAEDRRERLPAGRAAGSGTRPATSTTRRPSSPSLFPESHPPRLKRPQRPRRPVWTGRTIDGLVVPSAKKLDHAFAWVGFQLQTLERQDAAQKQLEKELRRRAASAARRSRSRKVPGPVHSADPAPVRAASDPSADAPNCRKRGPP